MRLLILGGTVFLGRALTDAALARGHEVTHVNRGLTAGTDARVETIACDRAAQPFLGAIDPARTWEAAIDTSGYLPQVVRRSAAALRERVARYAFVSSISVYSSFEREGFDETASIQAPPHPLPDALDLQLYGALKAGCEAVVNAAFGARALIVRPGLMVGPNDRSDRFTWWPHRAARGGAFAAPGRRERRIQLIDARDLAQWIVAMVERGAHGVYNATGPATALTMGELIDECVAAGGGRSRPTWLPDEFLLREKVQPWMQMPLWLPESAASSRGFMAADASRAVGEGLAFRPLRETVADTLAWSGTRGANHPWKAGLDPEREAALLAAWNA